MTELKKQIKNGRLLKNNGSWMYCNGCNKTVGYLCYTTYQYIRFEFDCNCGEQGFFELYYEINNQPKEASENLKEIKNRLCCSNDESPLFTIVEKNLKSYSYTVVCKKCQTQYMAV